MKTKKMIKLMVFVLLLLALTQAVFAYGGIMTGMHNLKVASTVYFDIIYPPESEKTAALVAQNVDSMYEGICADLNEEPWLHMPISISPVRDELNAYYSSGYYNLVVLYDTVPDESLAVFSQNILSVLYHELVHAVSMNMKSDVFKKMSSIFGDGVSLQFVTTPITMLEGVTVSFESKTGEGRLNNPFSTQIVKQAKIEGKFPVYDGTMFSRDIYPMGVVPYIFGGSFTTWFYNEYGKEKFVEFWRILISATSDYDAKLKDAAGKAGLFSSQCFKNVYGIDINDAWKKFYDSVKVPDVPADPIASGDVQDFFVETVSTNQITAKKSNDKFEQEKAENMQWNSQGSIYKSVTSCQTGAAWIDSSCGAVWYSAYDGQQWKKPCKLFTNSGISRISFSSDGQYLALSVREELATVKFKAAIYSIKNKQIMYAEQTGLRDATVITCADGTHLLAAVQTESQYANIAIIPIKEKNNHCTGFSALLKNSNAVWNRIIFSVCDSGNDKVAFIVKDGLYWSVQVYDSNTNTTASFLPPKENIHIQNLAAGAEKNTYLFSWAELGAENDALPRLGMLDLNGDLPVWTFQDNDISGGIHFPVAYPGEKNTNKIIYSGQFYDNSKLLVLNTENTNFVQKNYMLAGENLQAVPSEITGKANAGNTPIFPVEMLTANVSSVVPIESLLSEQEPDTSCLENAVSYNPLSYYRNGIFLPVSTVPLYNKELTKSMLSVIGATWMTSNPWLDDVLVASVSFDPITITGGLYAMLSGGTDANLFKYSISGTALFDKYGFCQTYDELTTASKIPVGNISNFIFGVKSSLFAGTSRSISDSLSFKYLFSSPEHSFELVSDSIASITFSNIHSTGPGRYESCGIFMATGYSLYYSQTQDEKALSPDGMFHNVEAQLGFCLPQILPFKNPYGLTLNLPLSVEADFFATPGCFDKHTATAVLFSAEVQQPISLLHIYINRLTLDTTYTGSLNYENPASWDILNSVDMVRSIDKMKYYDTVSATLHCLFEFTEGSLARFNVLQLDFSSTLYYRIRPEPDKSEWGFSICGNLLF